MNSLLLKILNPILLALVVNQFATGFFPTLYGRNTFRLTHKQMAWVLMFALLAHLALNRNWISHVYFKRRKRPSPRPQQGPTELAQRGSLG